MTPEQQAARWLADVPRLETWSGNPVIWEADALAAIARHLAPGDDLVEQASPAVKSAMVRFWKRVSDLAEERAETAEAEAATLRDRLARMEGAHQHAMEACRIIDEVVKEGHDNTGKMILHFLTAVEPARAALTDRPADGN